MRIAAARPASPPPIIAILIPLVDIDLFDFSNRLIRMCRIRDDTAAVTIHKHVCLLKYGLPDQDFVSEDQGFFQGVPVENHKQRSEEHTSELQSQSNLVCRLLLEKKKA